MKFTFKARDWNGKEVKGVLDLHDKSEAIESIKNNGLMLTSLTEVKETMIGEVYKSIFTKNRD